MFGDENIIELKVDDSNIKELGGIYPAQSSTWKTSSTNKLKYLEIRSINSADGVLSPRSILREHPKVCVNLQTDVCIILTVYRNFTLETTYVFVHILSPLNCGLICFILQTQSLLFIPVNL